MAHRLTRKDVLERLSDLFVRRGVPGYIHSDHGPECSARNVTDWLEGLEVKTLFIKPNSRWENRYSATFHGRLRYELLEVAWFETLLEAKVLIECWRVESNTIRPHRSLGYRPPTLKAIQTWPNSARRSLLIKNLPKKEHDMLNLT